jgi:tetratricopeptide (TPR) repeat protein
MEFERKMTLARVHRQRGDYAKAQEVILELLQERPDDLDVKEFAADLLFARGELEKALKHYKALFSPECPRPSAEEKYARTILAISEGQRQRKLLEEQLVNPRRAVERKRSALTAGLVSIAPGFGQIYLGKFVRGAVFFGVTMLGWLIFSRLAPDVSIYPTSERTTQFFLRMSPAAYLFAVIAIVMHLYAFLDTVFAAGKKPEAQ